MSGVVTVLNYFSNGNHQRRAIMSAVRYDFIYLSAMSRSSVRMQTLDPHSTSTIKSTITHSYLPHKTRSPTIKLQTCKWSQFIYAQLHSGNNKEQPGSLGAACGKHRINSQVGSDGTVLIGHTYHYKELLTHGIVSLLHRV